MRGRISTLNKVLSASRQARVLAFLAIGAIILATFFYFHSTRKVYTITLGAGDKLGTRYSFAEKLAAHAPGHGLKIKVESSGGSGNALTLIREGKLDAALIQGGIENRADGVVQVAALSPEPLQLLVKGEISTGPLTMLRSRSINLNTTNSGTRRLALELLAYAEMLPGRDFTEKNLSHSEIEQLAESELPDGIFVLGAIPNTISQFLISRRDYRLMELPFGKALALRDYVVQEFVIPVGAFGVTPLQPDHPMNTIATRLLLVASESVDAQAVTRLLNVLFDSGFTRVAGLSDLTHESLAMSPALPLHPGTTDYLNRNNPLITGDVIQSAEDLRSFLVSVIIAIYLIRRWMISRRATSFQRYMHEVSKLEREALDIEMQPVLDLETLLRIRTDLSRLKNEALMGFSEGRIQGEEMISAFLSHVGDVREYLNALILHERERMEKDARRTGGADQLAQMWKEATRTRGDGPQ